VRLPARGFFADVINSDHKFTPAKATMRMDFPSRRLGGCDVGMGLA
jgi:hypothetical protein